MEQFFKVCHVRKDGGVGELTLIGYGAESLAYQHFKTLELNEHIDYVCVIQRQQHRHGEGFNWLTIKTCGRS